MKRLIPAVVALGIFLVFASSAGAQYPPPIGSITAASSATSATAGGSVAVTCIVRDEAGRPLAGRPVTIEITSNPGNASLDKNQATSDAQGAVSATLNVGTQPGTVQVYCSSEGRNGGVTVQVLGVQATAVPAPSGIRPPSTGDGGLATGGYSRGRTAAAGVVLILVLLVPIGGLRKARAL